MEYLCRLATRDDAPLILELIKTSMLSYSKDSGIDSSILDSMHEEVRDLVEKLKTHVCFCYFDENNNPVGTITLKLVDDVERFVFSDASGDYLASHKKALYISRFAVSDALRGTGLGIDLLDIAFKYGIEKGASVALLHTAIANTNRVNFYYNRGFELIDSEYKRGYERGLFGATLVK